MLRSAMILSFIRIRSNFRRGRLVYVVKCLQITIGLIIDFRSHATCAMIDSRIKRLSPTSDTNALRKLKGALHIRCATRSRFPFSILLFFPISKPYFLLLLQCVSMGKCISRFHNSAPACFIIFFLSFSLFQNDNFHLSFHFSVNISLSEYFTLNVFLASFAALVE